MRPSKRIGIRMIIVTVRTLNEEHRIGQFCQAYKDADKILVADGGSQDNTMSIAKSFSNVEIRNYDKRVYLNKGYWRNNDSDHANFLFEWAYSYKPNWVIFDDVDCRPNHLLKQDYIRILENTENDVVLAVRVYLLGEYQYFPKLSSPLGEKYGQGSLWAWRGSVDLWMIDQFPHFFIRIGGTKINELRTDAKCLELIFPYCLLHYSWDTPERTDAKLKYHRESGLTPNIKHPLEYGGNLKDLESFMHE